MQFPEESSGSTPHPSRVVKLSHADEKHFFDLLRLEEEARQALVEAERRRNITCMEIEQKYGFTGKKWTVDVKDRTIVVE